MKHPFWSVTQRDPVDERSDQTDHQSVAVRIKAEILFRAVAPSKGLVYAILRSAKHTGIQGELEGIQLRFVFPSFRFPEVNISGIEGGVENVLVCQPFSRRGSGCD
jgi:hypothetical protein